MALSSCGGGGTGGDGTAPSPASYSVTATSDSGGSITPASTTVPSGSTATFTVTPSAGFEVGTVTGCNGSLSGTSYTTGTIVGPCSVSANFVPQNGVRTTGGDGNPGSDLNLIFAYFDPERPTGSAAGSLSTQTLKVTAATLRRTQPRWFSQHHKDCTDALQNGYCGFAAILMAADYLYGDNITVIKSDHNEPLAFPAPSQLGRNDQTGEWIRQAV